MKITITIEGEKTVQVANLTDHELRILFMDALSEYVSRRTGDTGNSYVSIEAAKAYVDRRYPGEGVYSGKSRQRKIETVQRFCTAALALKAGDIHNGD